MIAVICAMSIEAEALKQKLENVEIIEILNKTFYKGTINNQEIVLVICGIGKVSAGITTALLIEHFRPSLIINSGIAGGFLEKLNTLDLVVSEKVAYYDVDLLADNEEYGKLPDLPKYFMTNKEVVKYLDKAGISYHYGLIITADTFASDREKIKKLMDKYYQTEVVLAVDMESAAVGQVCYTNNVPFINLRVISDVIGAESQLSTYYNFAEKAADKSVDAILSIIK